MNLTVRLPREGEWWWKKPCPDAHGMPASTRWQEGTVRWAYTSGEFTEGRSGYFRPNWEKLFAAEAAACECGCLVLVNHG